MERDPCASLPRSELAKGRMPKKKANTQSKAAAKAAKKVKVEKKLEKKETKKNDKHKEEDDDDDLEGILDKVSQPSWTYAMMNDVF
jgi:hypothetical protein